MFKGASSVTIGMVLRDGQGAFLGGKNMRMEGAVSVFEAESVGVYEALSWIKSDIPQPMVMETDSSLTVQALLKNAENRLEVGNVFDCSRDLLQSRSNVSVNYVQKQANRVAHMMARVLCSLNCYNVRSSPPNILLETLLYDSSLS